MVDPVGVTLGAIALIAPVYDACDRAYAGLKIMARFGRDFQTVWRKLEGYWTTLYLLMERNSAHLQTPPDPRDPNHRVTKVVLNQLQELASQFALCENLINSQLRHSGIDTSQLGLESSSSSPSQAPEGGSTVSTQVVSSSSVSSDVLSTGSQAKEQKKSFLRKVVPTRWRKDTARNASNTHPVAPNVTAREEVGTTSGTGISVTGVRNVLRVPIIEEISENWSSEDSRRIHQATGTWVHMKWAHHIKADFEAAISHIQDAIHILTDILRLRDLSDSRRLLRIQSMPSMNIDNSFLASQSLLSTLHDVIGQLQKQSDAAPTVLSVALVRDSAAVWRQAARAEGKLSLGDSGLMLWVQAQTTTEAEESVFLMIEATQVGHGDPSASPCTLKSLSISTKALTDPQYAANDSAGYTFLGFLPAGRTTSKTTYKVFAEKKAWCKFTTLRHFLQAAKRLEEILSKQMLVGVFHRLLEAYTVALLIEPSCSNFQTQKIAYFHPSDKQYDSSNTDWLLEFYVTCGFGNPAPEQRLGMHTGPSKDPNAAIIELGLTLFELASHRTIEYESGSGKIMSPTLRNARKAALNNINEVEMKYGTRLADIVSTCLQANAQNHRDVAHAVVLELEDIKNELDRDDL